MLVVRRLPAIARLLVLALAVILTTSGCGAAGLTLVGGALGCAEGKLLAGIPSAVGTILEILASGGDVEGKLLALGEKLGVDLFGCALQSAHAKAAPKDRAILARVAAKKRFAYRGLPAQ